MSVNIGTSIGVKGPYCEIAIGTQIWMCENISDNIIDSKVYDDDEANRAIYGGLYTVGMFAAIEALYPGWHVPSQTEWNTLVTFLGGSSVAGGKLKEAGTVHWDTPNTSADNDSGFTALPGGSRTNIGAYNQLNTIGSYWSTTNNGPSTYTLFLQYNSAFGLVVAQTTTSYFSVRLIKD